MHLPIFSASCVPQVQLQSMDMTTVKQAEEENVYLMTDGCKDQQSWHGRCRRKTSQNVGLFSKRLSTCQCGLRWSRSRHTEKRLPTPGWYIHADSMQWIGSFSLSALPFSSSDSSCIGSSLRAQTGSSNWTAHEVKHHCKWDKWCVLRQGGYWCGDSTALLKVCSETEALYTVHFSCTKAGAASVTMAYLVTANLPSTTLFGRESRGGALTTTGKQITISKLGPCKLVCLSQYLFDEKGTGKGINTWYFHYFGGWIWRHVP